MSVKNYSPHLLDIYKLVSEKGEFRFPCGTRNGALALRARLHGLRRAMREEKHWLLSVAEACQISILPDGVLWAHRPDSKIEDALAKALKEQGFKDRAMPR
jgi:hypothetical protein